MKDSLIQLVQEVGLSLGVWLGLPAVSSKLCCLRLRRTEPSIDGWLWRPSWAAKSLAHGFKLAPILFLFPSLLLVGNRAEGII